GTLEAFESLDNESLLEKIRLLLDGAQRNPRNNFTCPKDTLCAFGTCSYPSSTDPKPL
ncbi:MAG: hypothetical protein GY940_28280, partial [bacterium]|nr:hypothetical protein [bacterium]